MRTINEIYEALKQNFLEVSGRAVTEGGDMSLRLMAVAAEIYSLEVQCEFVKRQAFPQTAEGEYLDYHAETRAITRGEAAAARGKLRFSLNAPAAEAVDIAEGLQCLDLAGNVFITAEKGTISSGETSCQVEAYAEKAGEAGNAAPGTVVRMRQAPAGVSAVINDSWFSGGCDRESDVELRKRVIESYRKLPNGANAAYYEALAKSVTGVGKVLVYPRKRGIGTVDIIFSADDGCPSQELLDEVQEKLEKGREICVNVLVEAPETLNVDVSAALSLSEGYDFAKVKAEAEKLIRGCFGGDKLGEGIYRAKLMAALMSLEGVENCHLSAPAADIPAAEAVLPVIGGVSISQAV